MGRRRLRRTTVAYLLVTFLQVVCFLLGRNSLKLYNDSFQYKYWIKIFRPKKTEIIPSSEWFALDNWNSFKVIYYDSKELVMFIMLFTITALGYLIFTTENVKHTHPFLSKIIPLILSLLSGYVVLYEVIAVVVELLN